MPPNVRPTIARVDPAMTMKFPLEIDDWLVLSLISLSQDAHNQSTRANLAVIDPSGVRTFRNSHTNIRAIAVTGRLRSVV